MIISVSGKIGSGKDTVGKIIQYLCSTSHLENNNIDDWKVSNYINTSNWQIKKFADKLKECVSIITGIPRADLEKIEVKDSYLGKEWNHWHIILKDGTEIKTTKDIQYDAIPEGNKSLIYNEFETKYTVRQLLQEFGTDACRNIIHPNFWVNALFSEYQLTTTYKLGFLDLSKSDELQNVSEVEGYHPMGKLPNWIITDMRFPNELKAVENRKGITIRVNRNTQINSRDHSRSYLSHQSIQHPSETALDRAIFNYTIDNNGTIEELIVKVREILIKEKIIQ